MFIFEGQKGFVALVTVLIVSALVLIVTIGLSLRTIDEMEMGLQKSLSSETYYFANLCAEDALMKLKANSNYSGDEVINIGKGSCTILPIEGNWTIKISASFSGQVKKMRLVISQIHPEIVVDSWQEVADF